MVTNLFNHLPNPSNTMIFISCYAQSKVKISTLIYSSHATRDAKLHSPEQTCRLSLSEVYQKVRRLQKYELKSNRGSGRTTQHFKEIPKRQFLKLVWGITVILLKKLKKPSNSAATPWRADEPMLARWKNCEEGPWESLKYNLNSRSKKSVLLSV